MYWALAESTSIRAANFGAANIRLQIVLASMAVAHAVELEQSNPRPHVRLTAGLESSTHLVAGMR